MPQSPTPGSSDLHYDDGRPPLGASPQSFRSGRSMRASGEFNVTPRGQRSRSQISIGGSIGKRSGTPAAEYLRYMGADAPYSPSKSFEHVPGGGADDEELDFELHDDELSDPGFEGLENVRACCDGKHTVGGRHHHHHHNHEHTHQHQHQFQHQPQHQQQNGNGNGNGNSRQRREPSRTREQHLNPPVPDARPSSPAFSFRSRAGSASSDGGGLFGGKLRFGSRRSVKTSTTAQHEPL
jgi:hypothetical protein